MFSESELYQRKDKTLKRETLREQQRLIFLVHRLDATFVLNLEKVCISVAKLGARDKGTQ